MSKIKSQASWTLGSSFVTALSQVVQLSIIARLVSVNELGTLAIVNVFLTMALVFQDLGLSNYLIYKQNTTKSENSCLFLISFTLGLIMLTVIVLFSGPISSFYNNPDIKLLLQFGAINFIFVGCASLYQANLIKNFKQQLLAKIEIIARIASFALTISYLFLIEASIIAVIWGMLANSLIKILLFILTAESGFSPLYKPDFSIARPAMNYGVFQLSSQIINQLRTQADQLIIGKLLGMELLGFYSIAKELILKPVKFINPLISRLLLPRFAKNQQNSQVQAELYNRSIKITAWANASVYSLIALLAWPIVLILYGEDFKQTALILCTLALFGMIRPLGGIFASLVQSIGKTKIEFKWNVYAGIVMLTTTTLSALSQDLIIMGLTLSITQLSLTVISYYYFNKATELNFSVKFIRLIYQPVLATLIMSAASYLVLTQIIF